MLDLNPNIKKTEETTEERAEHSFQPATAVYSDSYVKLKSELEKMVSLIGRPVELLGVVCFEKHVGVMHSCRLVAGAVEPEGQERLAFLLEIQALVDGDELDKIETNYVVLKKFTDIEAAKVESLNALSARAVFILNNLGYSVIRE